MWLSAPFGGPFQLELTTYIPMSQDKLIKLACGTCKRINYWSRKNKKLVTRKIELKKYCKWCKVQRKHKEVKK